MRAKRLIQILERCNPDAEIIACDDTGFIGGAYLYEVGSAVLKDGHVELELLRIGRGLAMSFLTLEEIDEMESIEEDDYGTM